MAFTESMGMGNSTFMNLESEVNRALGTKSVLYENCSHQPAEDNAIPLDAIDESPTNSNQKGNKTRIRGHISQMHKHKKKRFRKSKSDSTLCNTTKATHGEDTATGFAPSYSSGFFNSQFSIEKNESIGQKNLTSIIKRNFPDNIKINSKEKREMFSFEDIEGLSGLAYDVTGESNKNSQEDSLEKFELPVCSEDLYQFLSDSKQTRFDELEGDWNVVGKDINCNETKVKNANQIESQDDEEILIHIDDATFVCSDENAKEYIENTINSAKMDVQMTLREYKKESDDELLINGKVERKCYASQTDLPSTEPQSSGLNSDSPQQRPRELNLEELKRLSSWNLPSPVLKSYEQKGIIKMFDWQIECLSNPKVFFERNNLVYSAPTSAGKTLVSEILLIKTILELGKKVIMILPFVSVVREKMSYLQDILTSSGYRVEGFFGGYTPPGGFENINVAICTIEKANSLINKLMEQGKLDSIGTVIVDEIHLISDPGRGYILELLLAKVLYMSRKYVLQIQIITMSATLANIELLKKWLDAELYITDYRPVALQEMIKIGTKIFNNNLEFVRDISNIEGCGVNDPDHVAQLCIETIAEGCSVIVFCPSKDWCENLCVQLAGAIQTVGKTDCDIGTKIREHITRERIEGVKKQLKDAPTGLDSVLERTINFGCAFHHAGLTTEERDTIESSFKQGALKVIVATSTLSSGVNLPARRVIIRSPLFGGKQMSSLTYKQMIGRAGRTGKDTRGESILICTQSNAKTGKDLINAALNPIRSCLEMESSTHLKRALLEVISSRVVSTKSEIEDFMRCTLLNAQKEIIDMEKDKDTNVQQNHKFIFDSLEFLIEYEFVRQQYDEEKGEDVFIATRLGLACLASSMPPTDGLILFSELQKARRCFVLESELHAVYLVTPYSVCYQLQDLDWLAYLDLWEKLSPAMKKVGELVGVKESFLVRAMRGQMKLDYKLMQIHKRFYTALALQELVNETPIKVVAAKYKCTRGMLQSLQQMSATFAGIVTAFCKSLNWSMLSLIVGQFKERLYFGIHRDLIDLMRLPDLTCKRARALFEGGLETIVDLANADALSVEQILHNSVSFETGKQLDNEDENEKNKRNELRNFFLTGKPGLTVKQAASILIAEARQFLQYEIGVNKIKWNHETNKETDDSASDQSPSTYESNSTTDSSPEQIFHKRKSTEESPDAPATKIKKTNNKIKQNQHTPARMVNNNNRLTDQNLKSREKNSSFRDVDNNGLLTSTETENHSLNKIKGNRIDTNEKSPVIKSLLEKKNNNQMYSENRKESTTVGAIVDNGLSKIQNPIYLSPADKNGKINGTESPQPLVATSKFLINQSNKRISNGCDKSSPLKQKDNKNRSHTNNEVHIQSPKRFTDHSLGKNPKQCDQVTSHDNLQTETGHSPATNNLKTPNEMPAPRRSPRNHLTSSTQAKKQITVANGCTNPQIDDLFMDDSSFETNSAIEDAMKLKEHHINEALCNSLNKSCDEIFASQELNFQSKAQSTRILRSTKERTQFGVSSPLKTTLQNTLLSKDSIQTAIVAPDNSNTINLTNISLGESLMQNPIQLNSSHILSTSKYEDEASSLKCIQIIDVCGNRLLFKKSLEELTKVSVLGFSIGLEKRDSKRKPIIGGNLLVNQLGVKENNEQLDFLVDDSSYIAGISIVMSENGIFFFNLQQENTANDISREMKVEAMQSIVGNRNCTLQIYDSKEQLKILRKGIPQLTKIECRVEDPRVANWILQPDRYIGLTEMSQQFAPECLALIRLLGKRNNYISIGLDTSTTFFGKIRSSIEACSTMYILKGQEENLKRIGTGQLYKFFTDIEMPLQVLLCHMEILGFPANETALQKLYQQITDTMKKLETKIYETHGSRFNLLSSSAVGKVLGLHRKANGRISTSKQVLEKVDSPIAQMILVYRKLSLTLTKTIQPLLRCVKENRVRGNSITFTSTGRISMQEPNLQNIAKDFEVTIAGSETINISCRGSFFPSKGRCFISADFCQLEMRILAHLSQDPPLVQVMKSEKDIFTAIAAKWNKIPEDNISDKLRNGTKQICYGIIYGMGMKALSESLQCTEQEAFSISEQFHAVYPGIRAYSDKVIKFARQHEYVETITGRRRYLENINSGESHLKSQAERQAINSTIQGSAADIAKSAMLRIEKNIGKYREKIGFSDNSVNLVLHLHDELIYEVPEDKAKKIAKVISITMENCVRLSIPLKVKVKVGQTWADMQQINL